MSKLNVDISFKTKTKVTQEKVDIEDITNNESEFDDDLSDKKEISQVVKEHVFEYTNENTKVLKKKGKHFLEQNFVL